MRIQTTAQHPLKVGDRVKVIALPESLKNCNGLIGQSGFIKSIQLGKTVPYEVGPLAGSWYLGFERENIELIPLTPAAKDGE